MSEMISIDEFVALNEERFSAYRAVYAQRNPPPEYKATAGVNWFSIGALAVLVVASVLVSGSRTVVVFGGGLFGVMAFVMLEVGLIFYGYWRASRAATNNQREDDALTLIGMFLAFGVSLAANISAELSAQNITMPPVVKLAITLALAFSAPSLALIGGDKLGRELVSAAARRALELNSHKQAMLEWKDGLNSEWAKNKARWGVSVKKINPADPPQIPADSGTELGERRIPPESELPPRLTVTRPANPRAAADAHYTAHPEDLNIASVAENVALAERLGISKTVLYERRKAALEQAVSHV